MEHTLLMAAGRSTQMQSFCVARDSTRFSEFGALYSSSITGTKLQARSRVRAGGDGFGRIVSRNVMKSVCLTTKGSGRQEGEKEETSVMETSIGEPEQLLDRRELLLKTSVASLAMATGTLYHPGAALGAPIQAPDLSSCQQANVPSNSFPDTCCPPITGNPVQDFVFSNTATKVRPAAHLVDAAYVEKYNRAYTLLRALPADDPRRQIHQADVHCAYCDNSYTQQGTSDTLQIHQGWLFFPWHRWYLYFHERILASLINDDTFALPFWNWDDQSTSQPLANVIPQLYIDNAALYDGLRDPAHQPPVLAYLPGDGSTGDDATTRRANLNIMYQQVVQAKTPTLFMGLPYRAGDAASPGSGTLENVPHGPVHTWTGDSNQPNGEDMGTFYSAARDPIFFAHHANIDRLWNVWKTIPGGQRRDFTDPDWLDSEFIFYDENQVPVKVKVRDAVSTQALGYTYQRVDDSQWINFQPTSVAPNATASLNLGSSPTLQAVGTQKLTEFSGAVAGAFGLGAANAAIGSDPVIEDWGPESEGKVRVLKGDILRARVKRLPASQQGDREEVLVIEGIEVPLEKKSKFDVFINLPGADKSTAMDALEYVGTFYNVPHRGGGMRGMTMNRVAVLRSGIGDTCAQLGLAGQKFLVVTVVPKGDGIENIPIIIKGFRVEYD